MAAHLLPRLHPPLMKPTRRGFITGATAALAIQSGTEIAWDPKAYRILSPEPLNERMTHTVRGDWKQG